MKVTLLDMFNELGSWIDCSEYLTKAKQSKLNTTNNLQLNLLVKRWGEGMYDEDPQQLVQELSYLL